jgi:hypothetical protein
MDIASLSEVPLARDVVRRLGSFPLVGKECLLQMSETENMSLGDVGGWFLHDPGGNIIASSFLGGNLAKSSCSSYGAGRNSPQETCAQDGHRR